MQKPYLETFKKGMKELEDSATKLDSSKKNYVIEQSGGKTEIEEGYGELEDKIDVMYDVLDEIYEAVEKLEKL